MAETYKVKILRCPQCRRIKIYGEWYYATELSSDVIIELMRQRKKWKFLFQICDKYPECKPIK